MRAQTYIAIGLIVSATLSVAPTMSPGQSEHPAQARTQPGPQDSQAAVKQTPQFTRPQTPSPVGGTATVIGVDEPEKCLRIRSGPGKSYEIIGCAKAGDRLDITGVWTSNNWAQLANKGWVFGPQIKTDSRPPKEAYSQPAEVPLCQGALS